MGVDLRVRGDITTSPSVIKCRVCGRMARLTNNGHIYKHSRKLGAGVGKSVVEICPYSGRQPVKDDLYYG